MIWDFVVGGDDDAGGEPRRGGDDGRHRIPTTATNDGRRDEEGAPGGRGEFPPGRTRGGKDRGDRDRDRHNDEDDSRSWGIREAIHNIDRVFMAKRPPPPPTVVNDDAPDYARGGGGGEGGGGGGGGGGGRASQEQRGWTNDADDVGREGEEEAGGTAVVPVVVDDFLPANADAIDSNLPASDALECRASVVAFVINATDVKDECDGLRKAFDKACSVQERGGGRLIPLFLPVVRVGVGGTTPRRRIVRGCGAAGGGCRTGARCRYDNNSRRPRGIG